MTKGGSQKLKCRLIGEDFTSSFLDLKSSIVPVTALLSIKHVVLAGEGFSCGIYDAKSKNLLFSRRIFASQAIHGFRVVKSSDSEDEILVWGGRSLRRVCIHWTGPGEHRFVDNVSLGPLSACLDWILDVCVGHDSVGFGDGQLSDCVAYAITAHDELLAIGGAGRVNTLAAGSNCILFSAHLTLLNREQLVVASGTSFGQIIVWTCSVQDLGHGKRIHRVFSGHEGSVFDVRISDQIALNTGDGLRLLSSCSDDRTIRVWDISDLSSLASNESESMANSTGYAKTISDDCIASIMGHDSRIWRLRYLYPSQKNPFAIRIVSVGEDGSVKGWNLRNDSDDSKTYSLESLASISCHSGKNIWSIDIKDPASEHALVYTGGADGRIAEFTIHDNHVSSPVVDSLSEKEGRTVISAVYKVQKHLRDGTKMEKGFLRTLCLVPAGILVATKAGDVVLCNLNGTTCMEIASIASLGKHSISKPLWGGKLVFFGSSSGDVYIYDHERASLEHLFCGDGKILDLWVSEIDRQNVNILLSTMREPIMINTRLSRLDGGSLKVVSTLRLRTFRSIVTSSIQKRCKDGHLVVAGHRNGDICTFICPNQEQDENAEIMASHVIQHAHGSGEDAVTDMHWLEAKISDTSDVEYLVSVGRDGTLAAFEIDVAKGCTMRRIHTAYLPFISSIEGISYNAADSSFVVYGFSSNSFVAYDTRTERPIINVPCGGGHRQFSFMPLAHSDPGTVGGTLAWIQASELKSFTSQIPLWGIFRDGAHGQDIKSCGIAPPNAFTPKFGRLCATGAEDTDIALLHWSDTEQLSHMSRLRKHVSGVHGLRWSEDGRRLFSCGGFEELLVWRLTSCPVVDVGVVCESKLPIPGGKSDLRVTSFDVTSLQVDEDGGEFFITLGLSNCVFKTYLYRWKWKPDDRIEETNWQVLAKTAASSSLTNISHIGGRKRLTVLATGSDGYLSFWTCTSSHSATPHMLLASKQVHQSSIKAFAATPAGDDRHLVLTGGDDNALAITELRDKDGIASLNTALLIPNAHAAAVSAGFLLRRPAANERESQARLIAVTASTDQKIKVWEFGEEGGDSGVGGNVVFKEVRTVSSAVADIADMDFYVLEDGTVRVFVCGVGMETWDLDLSTLGKDDALQMINVAVSQ